MQRFKLKEVFSLLMLVSNLYAEPSLITCDRDRYFENEKIHCKLRSVVLKSPLTEIAQVTLRVHGKEIQKLKVPLLFGGTRSVQLDPPAPLRAVVPLEIEVEWTSKKDKKLLAKQIKRLDIFPQDSLYWVGKDEFKGKTILVEKSVPWVASALEALGIPYLMENDGDLQKLKRIDFRFNAANSQELDPQDPWTRWELVQMLRKGLGAPESPKDGEVKS